MPLLPNPRVVPSCGRHPCRPGWPCCCPYPPPSCCRKSSANCCPMSLLDLAAGDAPVETWCSGRVHALFDLVHDVDRGCSAEPCRSVPAGNASWFVIVPVARRVGQVARSKRSTASR